jgi:predicted secreted hydrolase
MLDPNLNRTSEHISRASGRLGKSPLAMSWRLVLLVAFLAGMSAIDYRSANASDPTFKQPIVLPRDNAMHPWAHTEWWYVVGHLRDSSGQAFGFETTLFKFNHLTVPGSATQLAIDRADVALTDVSHKRFLSSVSYLEPGLSSIALSSSNFSERLGGDRIWASRSLIHLQSTTSKAALRLTMSVSRPAILEGGTGIVPMGGKGFSYYYSYPNLSIHGRVLYQGVWRAVTGTGWLDHQWGNWKWPNIRGWTWGAFQINNGVDFSASSFRAVGGALHGVTVSTPNAKQKTFSAVTFTPTGHWTSSTDVRYGSGWIVTIPAARARLIVKPLVLAQEVYDHTFPGASYWEGDCSVSGTYENRPVSGQAYMELVGGSRPFQVP